MVMAEISVAADATSAALPGVASAAQPATSAIGVIAAPGVDSAAETAANKYKPTYREAIDAQRAKATIGVSAASGVASAAQPAANEDGTTHVAASAAEPAKATIGVSAAAGLPVLHSRLRTKTVQHMLQQVLHSLLRPR